jgi:hypothetical protein
MVRILWLLYLLWTYEPALVYKVNRTVIDLHLRYLCHHSVSGLRRWAWLTKWRVWRTRRAPQRCIHIKLTFMTKMYIKLTFIANCFRAFQLPQIHFSRAW